MTTTDDQAAALAGGLIETEELHAAVNEVTNALFDASGGFVDATIGKQRCLFRDHLARYAARVACHALLKIATLEAELAALREAPDDHD